MGCTEEYYDNFIGGGKEVMLASARGGWIDEEKGMFDKMLDLKSFVDMKVYVGDEGTPFEKLLITCADGRKLIIVPNGDGDYDVGWFTMYEVK